MLSSVKNRKYTDDLDSVLKKLYNFYQYYPKRMLQVKQVAESLQRSTEVSILTMQGGWPA
jgi:hypothetical protein